MNSTIGIKIIGNVVTAKALMIIKKYYKDEIPLSEIKKKIESNDYVAVCDYVDRKGIEEILKLNEKLNQENLRCEFYEHDEITTIEFLNNLIESYYETEKQIEEIIELETEE